MDSLEDIVTGIRGCLISTKGSCDIRQLKRDFATIIGCDIPFKKFGYKTLEDFLQSIPSLITKKTDTGFYIDAKPNEKTSHIADMVNRQKKSTKKTNINSKLLSRVATGNINRRSSNGGASAPKWRPRNVNNKWKTSYAKPSLPVLHNQFVSYDFQQPNVNNNNNTPVVKNNNIMESNYTGATLNKSRYIVADKNSAASSNGSSLNTSLKKELQSLIINSSSDPGRPITNNAKSSNVPVHVKRSNSVNDMPFQKTGDDLVDLYAFAAHKNIPEPNFKIITRRIKGTKNFIYDCKLEVNDQTYSSYPNDFKEETIAKQYTAKLALNDLMKESLKQQYRFLSSENDILQRIPPILEKHYHGMWSWQLEADYVDRFHEQLPKNWLEILDTSPCISVERCLNDKFVLRFCKPEEKGKMNHQPLASDLSVPSNTIRFSNNGSLLLLAQITCVISAKEIWCRQLDTHEAESYAKMVRNMNKTYATITNDPKAKARNMNVGGFYVALVDDAYVRVRILEINEEKNETNCFLIDFGDELAISKDNIYEIQRDFARDQAQAFICRLNGLEELYEVSYLSDSLQSLSSKTVYIERNPDDDAVSSDVPILSVIMYDLDNTCINEKLITQITLESAAPVLEVGQTRVVYVTNIESNGDVYVQIRSPGYFKLQELLQELNTTIGESCGSIPKSVVTMENSTNRLYFARYDVDGQWYRAKIIDWAPNRQHCQIYFVDYGNTGVINLQRDVLYSLDEISDVVSHYPEQAVKVRLPIDKKVPESFVSKLKSILPSEEPVTLKCLNEDEDFYVVEFYKRSEPNNILFCVSQCITLESELRNNEENVNRSTMHSFKLRRLQSLNQFEEGNKNVPSSGSLKAPMIPNVGDYFDVKIPFAVNPWNFFVQPYNSGNMLKKLMAKLQEVYAKVQYTPLQIDDIQHGKIYASKHTDGKWYRTSVIKVIHSGSISVFYCDFGYYANLTLQQLIPLDQEFLVLPYQAIKAKLSGIKPKDDKWSMEDCKFFEQLVCRKSFVSIIRGIEKDELYRCDTVLLLELIDTSTDNDIKIDEILIREKIAVERKSV